MLKPSYAELMDVLNQNSSESNEITSRYTIVIAAAKRARQIIEGDEPMVKNKPGKPLSTSVDEILKNKIKVVPEGEGTVLHFNKKEDNLEDSIKEKNKKMDSLEDFNLDKFNLDELNDGINLDDNIEIEGLSENMDIYE